MSPPLRPLAAPLALASCLTACGAPGAQETGSGETTLEPTSTTQVEPTTAPEPTGDPSLTSGSTGAPTDTSSGSSGAVDSDTGDTGDTDDTAAPVEPSWLQGFGAPDDQHPGGVGLATDGALWVAGDFAGSLDLGLGPLTGAGTGLYLARYTAEGEPTHAQALFPADGEPTLTQISGLGVDSEGAVIVTGWLEGTYTLGGSTLTADEIDVHVAKYDAAGEPVWGQRLGQVDWQVSHALAVGADDSIWISGATLAPFTVGDIELTGAASTGMFVIRLDPAGQPIFARWWGQAGDQEARGVAVCDDGSAAIVGFFTDPLKFGDETIEPLAGKDMFIARVDPQGEPLWIRAFVGNGTDYGTHVDCADDVVFAAVVTGDATIGDLTLAAGGAADVVLGRFDAAGTLTWAAAITGTEDQLPTGVVALADGATAVMLTTSSTATLGELEYAAPGQTDLLFAAYPAGATTPTQVLGLGSRSPQRAGPLTARGSVAAFAATITGTVEWPGLPPITTVGAQDLGLARFTPAP